MTESTTHAIKAITAMVKLALLERRYHEVVVLMSERESRIARLSDDSSAIKEPLILGLMADTAELEREIAAHVQKVSQDFATFGATIPARRAYGVAQVQGSGLITEGEGKV